MACLNSSSHDICTDVVGTFGCVKCPLVPLLSTCVLSLWNGSDGFYFPGRYMAPEYLMQGRMIDKIDVYAFGVVLLELLSSRKPINNEKSLVMWVSWCI